MQKPGRGRAEELGAWVEGMERWYFVLKAVVTGAEHLSWVVEWSC